MGGVADSVDAAGDPEKPVTRDPLRRRRVVNVLLLSAGWCMAVSALFILVGAAPAALLARGQCI